MEYSHIKAITGLVSDYHQRIIPDEKASIAKNILFSQGRIKNRWGYTQKGGNLPLSHPAVTTEIMNIVSYKKPGSGTIYLVAFTTRDAYHYNKSTGDWDLITKCYKSTDDTTTATSGGTGNRTITISAAIPRYDEWTAGSVALIKFGTADINGTGSPDTWYEIDSFDSGTQLTLAEDGPSVSAVSYVIRLCSSGDVDDEISTAIPYYGVDADKVLVMTNGVDHPRFWNGSGEFVDLGLFTIECTTTSSSTTVTTTSTSRIKAGMSISGTGIAADTTVSSITNSTTFEISAAATASGTNDLDFDGNINPAKYVGYFGSTALEHMIFGNVVDVGTGIEYPQRIEVTMASEIEIWGSSYDFLKSNDDIQTIIPLGQRLIVYKEKSITELYPDPSGGNDDPFNIIENKVINILIPSGRAVVDYGKFHIFYGESNIYLYDGVSVPMPVGAEVINTIRDELNRDNIGRMFAFPIHEESLYCLFIPLSGESYPGKTYVFNYQDKSWTTWEMEDLMTAWGNFFKDTSYTYDGTWAQATQFNQTNLRISDLKIYDTQIRFLLGDSAGYIYEFEETWYDDDDATPENQLITSDFELNDAKHTVYLLELIIGVHKALDSDGNAVTTTFTVEASVDFGQNWSSAVTVTETWLVGGVEVSYDYIEHTVKFKMKGKQVRFRITSSTRMDLEALQIGFNQGGIMR